MDNLPPVLRSSSQRSEPHRTKDPLEQNSHPPTGRNSDCLPFPLAGHQPGLLTKAEEKINLQMFSIANHMLPGPPLPTQASLSKSVPWESIRSVWWFILTVKTAPRGRSRRDIYPRRDRLDQVGPWTMWEELVLIMLTVERPSFLWALALGFSSGLQNAVESELGRKHVCIHCLRAIGCGCD